MFNCRRKRCCCLYNNMNHDDKCMYETLCNKQSYCGNTDFNMKCTCGFDDDVENDVFPQNPIFGQSYVPIQTLNETYMPNYGLDKGTIFPELVGPYFPGQSMDEIDYLMNSNEIKEGCNR